MDKKINEVKIHDLIIIGAGPAGLSAGVYAARYKLDTLIIGKIPGGTAGLASKICNFPSYEEVKGIDLMMKMIKHVHNLGLHIRQETVEKIKKDKSSGNFEVITSKANYFSKKIILATGNERRKLGLEKEKEFLGKGITYCATCDAAFYQDKNVAVVGGNNSALTAALLLANFAKKVYIIYRKNRFIEPEKVWVEDVKRNEKIEVLFESELKKLIGKTKLEKIEIERKEKKEILEVNGLFVEIGGIPNTVLAQDLDVKIEKGEILTDEHQETSVKGVFAAGDVTNNPLKQVVTACSEGAIAAYYIYRELEEEKEY